MRLVLASVLIAGALALSACETATPYQPLNAPGAKAHGGYFDHQIEADRYEVGFRGNSLTSRESVERYLLYRSAELTLAKGYDWFQDVSRHVSHVSDYVGIYPGGPHAYWSPRWGVYRPHYGWRYGYWDDPAFGPEVERIDRFSATSEIRMGRGPKPDDRHAFDAHAVVANLRSVVLAPQP